MAETKTTKNIYQRLLAVQKKARAPREVDGKFGKARSAEQILEAYKPICNDNGLYLYTTDIVCQVGDRNYVETTATVINTDKPDETHSADGCAWENIVEVSKSGSAILDTSQVTGKTSSYAKKYALQNLFAIDDTKDADFEHEDPAPQRAAEPAPSVRDDAQPVESELDRLKRELFFELNEQGKDTDLKQKAFITSVLKKSKIETVAEAEDVKEALRINAEREES